MSQKTKPPIINQEGWDLLMNHILKPSATSVTKSHDQLIVDEVKRHVQACVAQHFKVQS